MVRFLCAGTDKLIIAVLLGRDLDAERSFVPMNAPLFLSGILTRMDVKTTF